MTAQIAPQGDAERLSEIRALMHEWSTACFASRGYTPSARSLIADAGLELLDRLDAALAWAEAAEKALAGEWGERHSERCWLTGCGGRTPGCPAPMPAVLRDRPQAASSAVEGEW